MIEYKCHDNFDTCEDYQTKVCAEVCYFAKRLHKYAHAVANVRVTMKIRTGLQRFQARKQHALDLGIDWNEMRFGK